MISPSCSTMAPTAGVGLFQLTYPQACAGQARRSIGSPSPGTDRGARGEAQRGQNRKSMTRDRELEALFHPSLHGSERRGDALGIGAPRLRHVGPPPPLAAHPPRDEL